MSGDDLDRPVWGAEAIARTIGTVAPIGVAEYATRWPLAFGAYGPVFAFTRNGLQSHPQASQGAGCGQTTA